MVVIVITGIVLHPRFVVIGKCMAYKLSLFFYLHYFNLMHIFIVLNRLLFSRIDMRKLMQRHYLMSGGYYF